MPIPGTEQPEFLHIDEELRLRKFDDHFDFAFDWYQDPETVWLVDGVYLGKAGKNVPLPGKAGRTVFH